MKRTGKSCPIERELAKAKRQLRDAILDFEAVWGPDAIANFRRKAEKLERSKSRLAQQLHLAMHDAIVMQWIELKVKALELRRASKALASGPRRAS